MASLATIQDHLETLSESSTRENPTEVEYALHANQVPIFESEARFIIAPCGRRFGKTAVAVRWLTREARKSSGRVCAWIAPIYRQGRRPFLMMCRLIPKTLRRVNKAERIIYVKTLDGGESEIQFLSADRPEGIEGEGYHAAVIDEAKRISDDAWYGSIRPTLSDKLGRGLIISTPRGKRHWFYEAAQRGLREDEPHWATYHFPTACNPWIDPEEVAEAQRTLPEYVFRQQYLAEFLDSAASPFVGIRDCVQGELEPPRSGREYSIGVDVAKHRDWTVVTVVDTLTRHVVHWDRWRHVDWPQQVQRIGRIADQYPGAITLDSTGIGDVVYDLLTEKGYPVEPFKFTNQSKRELVDKLATLIKTQAITYPNIPTLIDELEVFEVEVNDYGKYLYNAPEGFHDDCVASLGLAVMPLDWNLEDVEPHSPKTGGRRTFAGRAYDSGEEFQDVPDAA